MAFDLSEEEVNGVVIAVNTILRDVLADDARRAWWFSPNTLLGGKTPKELIATEPTRVVVIAQDMLALD